MQVTPPSHKSLRVCLGVRDGNPGRHSLEMTVKNEDAPRGQEWLCLQSARREGHRRFQSLLMADSWS